ncbi:hypothetical protein [Ligilactobacillus salitolerans]|nr:hypothetical protein [Ligilactobacillus salitolerans]
MVKEGTRQGKSGSKFTKEGTRRGKSGANLVKEAARKRSELTLSEYHSF